ncbi:hypothetical protein [Paraflavitalea sp. CAU 1676]|uniref:hypothetical protein n=1 Tax=Paraflavitalea sp. CAU 1676 TaxID=3032598 RepID=UPI0023DC9D79|nr:hypothetical protein [Paraflavitalea sp. CAU 1676]MDF2187874.1 hypothetical protein [Paraflavitalea sp. CAU 1676]
MNQYLLLRDNKQTGPYSVEELKSKGLKAYDLVWLDGKSAAWRYPSEIEELKAFAPVVEEQPYDRFYKKKPAHQATATSVIATVNQPIAQPIVAEEAPVEAIVVNKPVVVTTTQPVAAKKIYVTLPAGVSNRAIITTSTVNTKQTDLPKEVIDETAAQQQASAELLNEKFARLREEKIRQAASKADKPVINQAIEQATPTAAVFSEIVEQNHPQPSERLAHLPQRRPGNNKLVMRSIAAACLLLAGVIIGLVISNSRQQQDNAALDQLVRQIQERDRQKRELAQNIATTGTQTVQTVQEAPAVITERQVPSQEPAAKKQVAAKETKAQTASESSLKESIPVKDVSQRQTVKVTPALVANKADGSGANSPDMEKTRKNIHQLVAVDANKYKIGVLGGISELQLTISNNSLYALDQVEVELRYLGPEKRIVKTQMLLFNDVAPGEQKTIEAPRTNRGVAVDYVITRINSKALGLAHVGH